MRRLIALAAMLAFSCISFAQDEDSLPEESESEAIEAMPAPDEMQKQMESAFDFMGPTMGKMMEAMIEAQLGVAAKPETAERLATYVRNFYDALVAKGFTKDEALRIVTSVSLPAAGPAMK